MTKQVILNVFDHDKLNLIPLAKGKWRHAFLKLEDGSIVLAEVMDIDDEHGGRGWCPASTDSVSLDEFNKRKEMDPDYYDEGMTFEKLVAWTFRGCFTIVDKP